jgi:ribonucleotide monophosphatase NagD (HAD superfamily)
MNYYKLIVASSYLRYVPGVRFVATNADRTLPIHDGLVRSGAVPCISITSIYPSGQASFDVLYRCTCVPSRFVCIPRQVLPGGGTMVNMIEFNTGRPPEVVVGKPNPLMLTVLTRAAHLDPARR